MNAKKVIRNLLLVFVAGSLAYMAFDELIARRAPTGSTQDSSAAITPATQLVVYYFSEGKECTTCEQIPLLARTALEAHFAKELESGAIVWSAIDVDDARNAHYIDEYGIYTKSIVLSRIEDGKQIRWKNLDRVWDLVYDKPAFIEYVQQEVRADLDAAAGLGRGGFGHARNFC